MPEEALTRLETNPYQGHLNHLDSSQQDALEKFRELLTSKSLYTPAAEGKEASCDDATLLRFLRARRFVPQEALKQFEDTENWRKSIHIDALYNGIDVKDYEETRALYPQWLGRRDKRGIPLYLFHVSYLTSARMSVYDKSTKKTKVVSPEDSSATGNGSIKASSIKGSQVPPTSPKLQRLAALYEGLLRFDIPLCNILSHPNPEVPITQSNNIVDISGVGLKWFWDLRVHMQDASIMANAHYPETLDRIFVRDNDPQSMNGQGIVANRHSFIQIVGAPSFFNIVWSWIKKWFDKNTTDKIFILAPHEVLPTLKEFIDIENIPKRYGGELQFEFGDYPVLEKELRDRIVWEEGVQGYPQGSLVVKNRPDGEKEIVAIGSEDGKLRNKRVARILATFKTAETSQKPAPEADSKSAVHTDAQANGALDEKSSVTKKEESSNAVTTEKIAEPPAPIEEVKS